MSVDEGVAGVVMERRTFKIFVDLPTSNSGKVWIDIECIESVAGNYEGPVGHEAQTSKITVLSGQIWVVQLSPDQVMDRLQTAFEKAAGIP